MLTAKQIKRECLLEQAGRLTKQACAVRTLVRFGMPLNKALYQVATAFCLSKDEVKVLISLV